MAKTAKGLVEYAKAQLGKPYWYGSFGNAASKEFYEQKKRQYPSYYKWEYTPEVAGQKVHDCVGLIKGYLWCDSHTDTTPTYNGAQDKSANGMYNACTTKGAIATIPEVAGVLVFMNNHVGVYIGNGEVIEAKGHKYGVVKTKLAGRAWKNWGYCPYITYEKASSTNKNESAKDNKIDTVIEVQKWLNQNYKSGLATDNSYGRKTRTALTKALQIELGFVGKDVDGSCGNKTKAAIRNNNLKKGSKGDLVKVLQGFLVCNGYPEAYVDGSFGSGTEKAVKAFQKKNGLTVDGVVGSNTFDIMCN